MTNEVVASDPDLHQETPHWGSSAVLLGLLALAGVFLLVGYLSMLVPLIAAVRMKKAHRSVRVFVGSAALLLGLVAAVVSVDAFVLLHHNPPYHTRLHQSSTVG